MKRWLIDSKALLESEGSEESNEGFSTSSLLAIALVLGLALRKLFGDEDEAAANSPDDLLDHPDKQASPKNLDPLEPDSPRPVFSNWIEKFKSLFSFSKPVSSTSDSSGKTLSENPGSRTKVEPVLGVPENIFRLGSFTREEADIIVSLHRSGINTEAKGGISKDLANYVTANAPSYGLLPSNVLRVISMESGGNPNAISPTGAVGAFQLTGATASSLGVKNRFNPFESADGAMRLMQENAKLSSKKGLGTGALPNYLVYQLGPKAASEVLSSDRSAKIDSLTPRTSKAVRVNYAGKSNTVGEYIDRTEAKLSSPPRMTEHAISLGTNTSPIAAAISLKPEPSLSSSAKHAQAFVMPSNPEAEYVGYAKNNQVTPDNSYHPLPQQLARGPGGLLIGT